MTRLAIVTVDVNIFILSAVEAPIFFAHVVDIGDIE